MSGMLKLKRTESRRPTDIFQSASTRERVNFLFNEDSCNDHDPSENLVKIIKEEAFRKKSSFPWLENGSKKSIDIALRLIKGSSQ